MLAGVEKIHVQKKPLGGSERSPRLYMSWFCQIPLFLPQLSLQIKLDDHFLLLAPYLLCPNIHA